ncbi:MAG: tRNA 2-thiouridine(34) synthase MnmA [Vulcanimicrobiaceae bacterium]
MAKKGRVLAAMSGGVDSAVAAGLLVEAGYEVIGVTMKMYAPTRKPHAKSCCGIDDFDDARRSCRALGIPHYVLNFEQTFRRHVIDRFAQEYALGKTPNPCVACNNYVKLGTLRDYADRLGAPYVATGHYARLNHEADGPHLFRGTQAKDQAYALAQLSPAQLSGLLLPLGAMDKRQTREHARRLNLPVHDKTESQDICFVEGGDYRKVLERITVDSDREGPIVNSTGHVVGNHSGITNFTIGQRRGLPPNDGGARYVTRIDAQTNTIVVGREEELAANGLFGAELNLIRPERFSGEDTAVCAMVRYRAALTRARARIDRDRVLRLEFERPQRAVAPGQLVAMFDPSGDEVLGGATITAAA